MARLLWKAVAVEPTTAILRPETKVVILDLDGTLYSKRGLAFRMVMGDLLEVFLLFRERQVRKMMRGSWYGSDEAFHNAFFANMVKGRPYSVDFMRWWYNACYMPMMVNLIRRHYHLNQWVRAFVDECHRIGIRIAVLSDYESAREKLSALGCDDIQFDWVVSAPELGGLKPARQLIDKVTGYMMVKPEQCFIIGDRDDTDGALARAAQIPYHLIEK